MDNGTTTNEQLRAIERWENEGGKIFRAVSMIPIHQMEIIRNGESAAQE